MNKSNKMQLIIEVSVCALFIILIGGKAMAADLGCSATAQTLRLACDFDVRDDFFVNSATCIDMEDAEAADECQQEAIVGQDEDSEECTDVLAARLELCESLADAAHEPEFGEDYADNFVDPLEIGATVDPNPYIPLVQGNVWVYEGTFLDDEDGEEVTETITVTVTNRIKMIEGIPCLVVTDTAVEDEEMLESTDDWFAQDVHGNVWYCGEISTNFEFFDGDDPEEPELIDIEGSWKAGREGSKAGILMPAVPVVGDIFRQELAYTDAEDVVEIIGLEGEESSIAAACDSNCLITRDFSPLEPDADENKYYLPGVGLILEVDNETGNRLELIEYN